MQEKTDSKTKLRNLRLEIIRKEHARDRRYRSFLVRTYADPEARQQEIDEIIKMDKEIQKLRRKIRKLWGEVNGRL